MRELSLHILDAMENAVEAKATRIELFIREDLSEDALVIRIKDNGRGMSDATLAHVLDPFFTTRTTRHVGLGLPLFAAAAQRCNGRLTVDSQLGVGTTVVATFQHSHIDRAPLGYLADSVLAVVLAEGTVDVAYRHEIGEDVFELDTRQVRSEIADVPLHHPLVREWLQDMLSQDLTASKDRSSVLN